MTLERCFYPADLQLRDNGDGRTLVGPLLPWGVRARVVDQGRLVTETFERGALAGTDPGPGAPHGHPSPRRWHPAHRRDR
jgi:hypothetical protein